MPIEASDLDRGAVSGFPQGFAQESLNSAQWRSRDWCTLKFGCNPNLRAQAGERKMSYAAMQLSPAAMNVAFIRMDTAQF